MPSLHPPTLSLVAALIAAMMAAAMFVLWRGNRTETAVHDWFLGFLAAALGFILFEAQHLDHGRPVHPAVLNSLAGVCFVAGQGLFLAGVEVFRGREPSWRIVGTAIAVMVGPVVFVDFGGSDPILRIVVFSLVSGGLALATAWRLLAAPRDDRNLAVIVSAVVCVVHAAHFVGRLPSMVARLSITDWVTVAGLQALAQLDGIVLLVALALGFVAMVNGRLIRQRLAHEAELAAARDRAEAASRAKSRFLANMSHELRTPLNAVLGFAQLLELNPKEPLSAAQKSSVDSILAGGRHLLELINDVLDLARVEAGRLEMSVATVDAAAVIEESLVLVRSAAARRGIAVGAAPTSGVRVRADRARLGQCLLNLLSNAVKYNRDGGTVNVRLGVGDDGRVRIAVADTGPGIDPARLGELFQPFNRLGAEARAIEGTGVGLALTRQLIERMGGRVGCESEPGRGSTFWLDVPAASA